MLVDKVTTLKEIKPGFICPFFVAQEWCFLMQFLLSSIKHNECYLCVKASLISVFHFFPWTDRFSTATQNSFYWEYIGSRKELYYKMNMGLSLQDMVSLMHRDMQRDCSSTNEYMHWPINSKHCYTETIILRSGIVEVGNEG